MSKYPETIGGLPLKSARDALRKSIDLEGRFCASTVALELRKQAWRGQLDAMVADGRLEKRDRGLFSTGSISIERQMDAGNPHWRIKPVPAKDTHAATLVEHLLKDDYAADDGKAGDEERVYKLTVKGNALLMASLLKRINRAKADAIVQGVIERAEEINARRDMLDVVRDIKAFGSYVSDTDDLGDVDLAVAWERRPVEGSWTEANKAFAEASGRRFGNFLQQLSYHSKYARQLLTKRSPYISLHDMSELEENPEMFGATKTIYHFDGKAETHKPLSRE